VGNRTDRGGLERHPRPDGGIEVKTVLETTAGQGTGIGSRFEHLPRSFRSPRLVSGSPSASNVPPVRRGHDLTTDDGYGSTFTAFDRIIGLDRLLSFHLNDSKEPLGSHVDRHEHIGKGCLGRNAFRRLVNDPGSSAADDSWRHPRRWILAGGIWIGVNLGLPAEVDREARTKGTSPWPSR